MKRRTVLVVVFSLLMSALHGCERKDTTTEKAVHLGSFSAAVDYGPYFIAKNKGWFDEALKPQGLKPDYALFQSLPPVNEAFGSDRLDIVFEAEPPAIVGRAAGIDLKIVALSCTLVQEILVPKASTVQSPADLKGKKIAVLAGTSSHYGLLKILGESGVKPDEVEIIDMVPPDAKNAFGTGKVDAWAVWPPWVEQEEIAGTGRTLKGGDAVIHSIMAVRSGFAKEHPEALRVVFGTLKRAKSWMKENPGEAQQIVAKELNVPLEVVKKAWPRHDWAATITDEVVADIERKAKFLQDQGFIKKPVDVHELMDKSFQEK